MNLNLLKCALFNRHKYNKPVRLDENRIEKNSIYCRHEVIIYHSIFTEKTDELKNDVIEYLRVGSFHHARASLNRLIEKLERWWWWEEKDT